MFNMKCGILILICAILQIQLNETCGQSASSDSKFDASVVTFRIAKVNQLWEKAMKRLSKPKLEKLMSELKIQDTEELTLKKLKASGGDKDGLKEAAVRKKLLGISERYGLGAHHHSSNERHPEEKTLEKMQFKDKKLNRLWHKAELSGLTQQELKTLREEFQHHQDKIDEYHVLISKTSNIPEDAKQDFGNDLPSIDEPLGQEEIIEAYNNNVNEIRTKHQELKKSMKQLNMKAVHGPDLGSFSESKVADLWKMALQSDFDAHELDALHQELKHYEQRLKKLSHLEGNLNKVHLDKYEDLDFEDREKVLSASETEARKILNDRLTKQERIVHKLHSELENKIIRKHTEL